MIQNVTYHCPNCKVAITTDRLTKHVQSPGVKTINKIVWRVHSEAYYTGNCYNCNEPLTIDKNGINHQRERENLS